MFLEADLAMAERRATLKRFLDLMSHSAWIKRAESEDDPEVEELTATLNFFEDSGLFDDAAAMVGLSLLSPAEASAIEKLRRIVDAILDPDRPESWLGVVEVARAARAFLA